jgi:inorganic pyrophosphatase
MNLHSIQPIDKDGNLNVIVEIQKGSKNKYELDKETGMLKLDRVMYTGQDYPFDYGFVPNTLWHDGDPLDVVLYTTYPLVPGILLEARAVAVMDMIDGGESDMKIIAVPVQDPRMKDIVNMETTPKHFIKEVQHFMETYKLIQNKVVEIKGVYDEKKASEVIAESIELFKKQK